MKWIAVPILAATLAAMTAPAETQSVNGCWNYSDGTVFSSVCLRGDGRGTFNLEYATEDPDLGMVKGSCNGRVEVEAASPDAVSFAAPYQDSACRQGDLVFRLARREYVCTRDGRALSCDLTVFYDDGSVYSRAEGLSYRR